MFMRQILQSSGRKNSAYEEITSHYASKYAKVLSFVLSLISKLTRQIDVFSGYHPNETASYTRKECCNYGKNER